MAGDWIKWVKGLVHRREVLAVSAALGIDRRIVACSAMLLWEWADDNTTDGHIAGVAHSDIDSIVNLPGFSAAMGSVGWIRATARGISIVNFDHHNGESAKARALNQKHQQASRKRKETVRDLSEVKPDKGVTRARATESREREAEKKQQAATVPIEIATDPPAPLPAAALASRGEVCSLLLAATWAGSPVFRSPDAAAIAASPRATRAQVAWALERFAEERNTEAGKARIRKPAGFIRGLIENHEPPAGWIEKFNRAEIRRLAGKAKA